jgi:hypothetical protein
MSLRSPSGEFGGEGGLVSLGALIFSEFAQRWKATDGWSKIGPFGEAQWV